MTQATTYLPKGLHSLTAYLVVDGAAKAIEFYTKALDAQELERHAMPGTDKILHAKLKIGDSVFMLSDEFPDAGCGVNAPTTLKSTTAMLHLYVPNVDEVYQKAVDAGATAKMPVADVFWGERYGQFADPFGHVWSVATQTEVLSAEEVEARASKFMPQQKT